MKHVLFVAAATVLVAAGSVIAGDRHHHSSHFGTHYHRSHGVHYGLHRSHHGGHYSGFSFGLSRRSYGYYSYPSYRYSYPSSLYYSTPRYRSYSYSNPSCVVQLAPTAPRRELQNPAYPEGTRPPKKAAPAPQPVSPPEPPPDPSPNARSFDNGTAGRVSVASIRTVHHGNRIRPAGGMGGLSALAGADPALGILGPQLAAPQTRSLVADDAVPFIVPLQQDRPAGPVAVQDTDPLLSPPSPAPPVVEEPAGITGLPSIPKAMRGIALLSAADQKAALAQRTCPVTGDLLGADGKPLQVQVAGRTVFVCCEGCADDLKANPQKYLDTTSF